MDKICMGCGSILQSVDENKEGYIPSKVFDKALYCERCFKIKNYNSSKEASREVNINEIITSNDPVIFVLDIVTMSTRAFDIIKSIKNPVYIVLTKKDLLPKSVKDYKIIEYVKKHTLKENVFIVSSLKKYNIDYLYNTLIKDKYDRYYVVGFSNAGKSALIDALCFKEGKKTNTVISSTLNTTLENIEIKLDKITLIDTPGLFLEESIINNLSSYKSLFPKKEIKPRIYVLKKGFMLLLNDLVRIENNSEEANISFYISNSITISKYKIERRDTLKEENKVSVEANNNQDIVIEGLGFIKVINDCTVDFYLKDTKAISKREKLI